MFLTLATAATALLMATAATALIWGAVSLALSTPAHAKKESL